MGHNMTCATNYNHRLAATLYTLEERFLFRHIIVRLNSVLNADDDNNNNKQQMIIIIINLFTQGCVFPQMCQLTSALLKWAYFRYAFPY